MSVSLSVKWVQRKASTKLFTFFIIPMKGVEDYINGKLLDILMKERHIILQHK